MKKSVVIERIQESIDVDGDELDGSRSSIVQVIGIVFGEGHAEEYERRAQIVSQIIKAKREVRADMKAPFFEKVWPEARDALLEKRRENEE